MKAKLYKHDIQFARNKAKMFQEMCSESFATHSRRWYSEYITLKLMYIATRGLPDCYCGITGTPEAGQDGFLFDFWADFPWNETGLEVIEIILKDLRFPGIVTSIKRDFDFDMKEELEEGLKYRQTHDIEGFKKLPSDE